MIVISPHLDDGVFGCGALLAAHPGSVVLTVFAGTPGGVCHTAWDARCGFADAREAMAAREREDDAALALLGARPLRLGFLDSQYGDTPARAQLTCALREALAAAAAERVLIPLGLFHSDHRLAHDAGRDAALALPDVQLLLYEDALYRRLRGLLQQRLAELARDGCVLTPAPLEPSDARAASLKRNAVLAYRSQLRAFGPGGCADVEQPERYWTLERDAGAAA